jgi:hypothetical protein
MRTQAQQIELSLKPVTDGDLRRLGASVDAAGVWTFPDGSCGRILQRPVPVYSDAQMTEKLGLSWFDTMETVH